MTDASLAILNPNRLPAIRKCDGCTLCCKVLGVREMDKPRSVWCEHCRIGVGCGIYHERPHECATYECGYLVIPGLGPEWKPSTSRLILSSEVSETRLNIHVDPARPDAWRKQPYYGVIKDASRRAVEQRGQVIILIGERTIVVLPDHEVDLGDMDADELIVIMENGSPGAFTYEAFAVKRDTAAGAEIAAANGKPLPFSSGRPPEFRAGRRLA